MSRTRASFTAEKGIQGNGYVSPRVFGAKGDGLADDLTPIQNAINAAKNFNGGTGGTVVLDGSYRISNSLAMDSRVSLEGVCSGTSTSDGGALYMDHATNGMFSWTVNAGGKAKGRISNLLLSAMQGNTGNVFDYTNGLPLDLLLDNVVFNPSTTGLLQGRFFGFEATGSKLAMRNCKIHMSGTAKSFLIVDSAAARVTLTDCELRTPTSYNTKLIDLQAGSLTAKGCDFLAGLTPGTAPFINLGGTAAVAVSSDNTFRGSDGNVQVAYTWSAAGKLVATNNVYGDSVFITALTDQGLLADHSKLELSPYDIFNDTTTTPSLPPLYDQLTYRLSNASAPTITMPPILYKGRVFRFNIKNESGSGWTPTFSGHVPMATVGALSSGLSACYTFIANDVVTPGTVQWMLVSVAHN